jgi:type II secretory pathway component PulF
VFLLLFLLTLLINGSNGSGRVNLLFNRVVFQKNLQTSQIKIFTFQTFHLTKFCQNLLLNFTKFFKILMCLLFFFCYKILFIIIIIFYKNLNGVPSLRRLLVQYPYLKKAYNSILFYEIIQKNKKVDVVVM